MPSCRFCWKDNIYSVCKTCDEHVCDDCGTSNTSTDEKKHMAHHRMGRVRKDWKKLSEYPFTDKHAKLREKTEELCVIFGVWKEYGEYLNPADLAKIAAMEIMD